METGKSPKRESLFADYPRLKGGPLALGWCLRVTGADSFVFMHSHPPGVALAGVKTARSKLHYMADENLEQVARRVIASIKPGDEPAVEGVRFLEAILLVVEHPIPQAAAAGRKQLADLVRALREHSDSKTIPQEDWLKNRIGMMASLAIPHWPFLFSVFLPSFVRSENSPDASVEEEALTEWAAVQMVVAPGRVGEELGFAVARNTHRISPPHQKLTSDDAQRALDEAHRKRKDRDQQARGASEAGRVRRSAFYRPTGDVKKALSYAKEVMAGHDQDAIALENNPVFKPATFRRLRREYQTQLAGGKRDEELFLLMHEYFSRVGAAQAGAVANDFDAFQRDEQPDSEGATRRDELAAMIRDIKERRRTHRPPGVTVVF